jgi:hypothetical protein
MQQVIMSLRGELMITCCIVTLLLLRCYVVAYSLLRLVTMNNLLILL